MEGIRKLFIAVVIIGVVVAMPEMNEYQAKVLVVVMTAFAAGNAMEHAAKRAGGIQNALGKIFRRGASNRIDDTARDSTDPPFKP
jgi:hypothetical protein